MAKKKSYVKQVIASMLVTAIIMATFFYAFGAYIIPRYQFTQEQIYTFTVKLFPFLVGLVMIQAGVVVAHRNDEEREDQCDNLPPNAYDAPLKVLPNDDPSSLRSQDMVHAEPVVVPEEATPIVEKVATITKQEIAPTVSVPSPCEMCENTLQSRLDSELESAAEMDYDLTIVFASSTNDSFQKRTNERLANLLDNNCFAFELEDGREALIFPFYNLQETEKVMESALQTIKREQSGNEVKLGYASRCGRILDGEILISEATS